jgi:oxygen-dependent protoporphyrinogen oxidase
MAELVAVVGGGISGLAAAHALVKHGLDRIVLLEAEDRVGGKIRSDSLDGVGIELGPDSFLAREPHAVALCEELGMADELVAPAAFGAHIWRRGELREVPPGFTFGVPADPVALLRSRLLSPIGAGRALADVVLAGPLTGPDVSVGAFVRRRFGSEVLDRVVDPLLAGTRAGSPHQLSLAAAVPQIDEVARRHRSVLVGSMRARGRARPETPPFLAPRTGMQGLIDRLRLSLLSDGVDIRTGSPVLTIARAVNGYALRTPHDEVVARGAVLASPAFAAADSLAHLAPTAAAEAGAVDHASVAIINLLFPPGVGPLPARGTGILVPSSERRTIAGCTWTARKWPHVAPADGRVPIRCFAGRSKDDPALLLGDVELAERAARDVREALGWRLPPLSWNVTRWPRAVPQYAVGHLERLARLERALEAVPGIAVAGAAYRGPGIPECISQAQEAARRVSAHVRSSATGR